MKRRKTKGSSMLIVVALFGILSILGTSMLAATGASYKLRIEEGNRMKNLYAAESGIEMSYAKMSKIVQEAVNKGVQEINNKLKEKPTLTREERNTIFKMYYTSYIDSTLKDDIEEGTEKYFYFDENSKSKMRVNISLDKIDDENYEEMMLPTGVKVEVGDRRVVLDSTFTTISTGKERSVSVSYVLEVPDSYRIETTTGEKSSNLLKYVIASDGDLNLIDNLNTADPSKMININGDVWVQGSMAKNENGFAAKVDINNKYTGGIQIRNSRINFAGDINTASNINMTSGELINEKKDSSGIIVPNNIYAENILLGDKNNPNEISGIKFSADKSNIYLANDLVISSSDAQAQIKNLYGFNDLTTEKPGAEFDYNNTTIRGSSSIIVNSDTWPYKNEESKEVKGELKVTNEAYLMGSAYIKTDKPYQTGESVALKGNYKVYTEPVDGYKYEYVNPLYLVTKKENGQPLSINDKAQYFVNNSNKIALRAGGITLPTEKTYTAGAYISEDKVNKPTVMLESQVNNSFNQKKQYVKSVYFMDELKYDETYTNEMTIDNFNKGFSKNTVENQINWDAVDYLIRNNMDSETYRKNVINLDDITLILNNDKNKRIIVYNTAINLENTLLTTISNEVEENGKKRRYIIVTEGDVEFKSNIDYNGAILAKGDINIKDTIDNINIGMEPLTPDELISGYNIGVLDYIFTIGNRKEGNLIVQPSDLISKERWTLKR